jgi:succinate dehydrogenase / fumarate reductase membrane anchor subunit
MVKSVLSVSHQGLRDWVMQRLSAVIMAVYSMVLFYFILTNPELSYAEWHSLFSETWVKVGTLLFVLALCYHAWIGIWVIFTDYVKNYVLRAVLEAGAIIMLTACFLWAIIILWSLK